MYKSSYEKASNISLAEKQEIMMNDRYAKHVYCDTKVIQYLKKRYSRTAARAYKRFAKEYDKRKEKTLKLYLRR